MIHPPRARIMGNFARGPAEKLEKAYFINSIHKMVGGGSAL